MIPPRPVHIIRRASPSPDSLPTRFLDNSHIRLLCPVFDLDTAHASLYEGSGDLQDQRDGSFDVVDNGVVSSSVSHFLSDHLHIIQMKTRKEENKPRRHIRPPNHEEIRKPMHRAPLVAARTTGFLPVLRRRKALSPLEWVIERVGLKPMREDQHVTGF